MFRKRRGRQFLSIAQERGFELNESAQLLKQQRSNTVLIIVKGTANELFAGMVEHLQSLFLAHHASADRRLYR